MSRISPLRLSHRLFVGAFFLLVAVPLLTHHWHSDPGVRESEHREAAPLPAMPHSWPEILAWPKQADAYLADHFGQRTAMVKDFNRARFRVFGEMPSEQTVLGTSGRIFLTSHSAASPYLLIRFICGADVEDGAIDGMVTGLESLLRHARTVIPESYLMVVPTAPALYPDALPYWLRNQCAAANTTMNRVMAKLPQDDLRQRLIYPLEAMKTAEKRGEVIPLSDFHWLGLGAETAAKAFAEGTLGLSPRMSLVTREEIHPSDIAHLMPGVPTRNVVRVPDFAARGVDYCWGPTCFPELGPMTQTIFDLSRTRSPGAGNKKLLILSDSFGAGIAGWFAPYFGSVWHFAVSNLARLPEEQREAFRHRVFDEYRPDVVLYLFHDGSVHYWPQQMAIRGVWGN